MLRAVSRLARETAGPRHSTIHRAQELPRGNEPTSSAAAFPFLFLVFRILNDI